MDRIDAMRAFVTVANEGGFTKAANKLAMSNQLVSKYVSQLEEHLSVRLFNRTTRKVHLTEAGEQCFQHAQQILENVQSMEGHFGQFQNEATGRLHINAPVSFSTLHLADVIRDFKKQHPAVSIDLQLSDRKVDLIEEGVDVALRIGHLKSSSLIARKIAPVRLVLCASPGYFKEHGVPEHPDDLIPEHFLRYSFMEYNQTNQPLLEALRRNDQKRESGLTCNNGEVLMTAAMAGEGYIFQPTFIVGQAIKEGLLMSALQAYEPEPMGLYVVYPHRKLLAPKLRVFVDFIITYFGQPPYWDS